MSSNTYFDLSTTSTTESTKSKIETHAPIHSSQTENKASASSTLDPPCIIENNGPNSLPPGALLRTSSSSDGPPFRNTEARSAGSNSRPQSKVHPASKQKQLINRLGMQTKDRAQTPKSQART
ncbi:hypothetical protein BJ508DRAFT_302335 [Ascobolus immersus RN42]|uniref:Uncharacterized protein n=1 Tax=Ascobolus immersus RN42 TaxID=1160509 RepID=A0A3N4IML7_ASCIM|nr:hypothetical protein BJ508DRAFT_302335 [Ascobolus immersus RN42]